MIDAPERIWINKVYGQHPEDWDFTDGKHLTKRQLSDKVEYVRADLVQAAVAAALREVAAEIKAMHGPTDVPRTDKAVVFDEAADRCIEIVLALVTPDAQAALEEVKREVRNEALREAAEAFGVEDDHVLKLARNAILAAMKGQDDE